MPWLRSSHFPLNAADERIGELVGSDRVLGRQRDVVTRGWLTDIRGATGTDRPTQVGLLPQRGPVVISSRCRTAAPWMEE